MARTPEADSEDRPFPDLAPPDLRTPTTRTRGGASDGDSIMVALACIISLGSLVSAPLQVTQEAGGIRAILARPTRSLADRTPGPGIYRGVLTGPADRRTVLGDRPAAGLVQWVSRHTTRRRWVLCEHFELEGMKLRDGENEVGVRLRGPVRLPSWGDSSLNIQSSLADDTASATTPWVEATGPSEITTSVPSGLGWCAGWRAAKAPKFHERYVPSGVPVTVSLCRVGDELQSCGSSGDFIAFDGPRAVAGRYQRQSLVNLVFFFTIFTLGPPLALGVWLSLKHRARAAGRTR